MRLTFFSKNDMLLIQIDFASPAFDEYAKMRYEELLEPLGLDWDENDILTEQELLHYGLYDADFQLLGGAQLDTKNGSLKQIVIEKAQQQKGLGRFLLQKMEEIAAAKEIMEISLLAHEAVIPFYEKVGYKKIGEMTPIEGIAHQLMRKVNTLPKNPS